jgi:hypothetical protein
MRTLIFAVLLAGPALADDMVLTGQPGYYARLQDVACTNAAILAHVKPDFRHAFKAGVVGTPEATIPACWVSVQGHVLLTFEDGSDITLPVTGFRKAVGL